MYIDTGKQRPTPRIRRGGQQLKRQHAPGEDEWGYEDAGERWLPVHSVETVVSCLPLNCDGKATDQLTRDQLISVISLLSADVPDLNSPANVDAAKEVREDFACGFPSYCCQIHVGRGADLAAYKKKVKRLARRSAEEAYE